MGGGLIFGGVYLWREIDWASHIVGRKFTVFALFFFVFAGISKHLPPGGLYLAGRFNGGFFTLRVWGAYTWRGLFSEFYSSFLFSEVKNTKCLTVFSVLADSSHKICIPLHCSWSGKARMSPKRILKVDFSYLSNCTEFSLDFRK